MHNALGAVLDDPADPGDAKIPPDVEIDSPQWFQQVDPARSSLEVTGQVYAAHELHLPGLRRFRGTTRTTA